VAGALNDGDCVNAMCNFDLHDPRVDVRAPELPQLR
jgi:hypothetical protein